MKQNENGWKPPELVKWNPGIAAVLSLFLPGAGQMYKGQVYNGLLWMVFVVIGYIPFIIPGAILHILCIIGAASGKNTVRDPNAPTPNTHITCPDCREPILIGASRCKHCGTSLIPHAEDAT